MSAVAELAEYMTTADNWWGRRGLARGVTDHARISALSVAVATGLALPAAVVLGHVRRGGQAAVVAVNLLRSVPSFAIVGLAYLPALRWGLGLGFWPTVTALVVLAVPPIFVNAYTGVVSVDPVAVEAARAMGLRAADVLWRVELPVALPLVLTGLRVAAVQVVATATLGALVGFGGLGAFIIEGFAQFDTGKLLSGAVLVGLMAIVTDAAFSVAERALTPWRARTTRPRRRRPSAVDDLSTTGGTP